MDWLWLLAFLALAGLIWYAAHLRAERRRRALEFLAAQRGWQFDPGPDRSHDDRYSHFAFFRQGRRRAAYNTMRGTLEIDGRSYRAQGGDYRYTVSHGKSSTTYRTSYLIVHLPFVVVPELHVRREGFFDRVAGAFGFDDIDFESEEFSRRFHVKSGNRRFAYDVIHPKMMEFLLEVDPPVIAIARGQCCIAERKEWRPDQFQRTLWWVERFFGLWPEHLVRRLDGGEGG